MTILLVTNFSEFSLLNMEHIYQNDK